MLRYLTVVLMAACTLGSYAQKTQFAAPDYKKISKSIVKKGSSTSYQTLMERYKAHDTTLSPKEYYLLYYGFPLQTEFNPGVSQPLADSLMLFMQKDQKTNTEYSEIIRLAQAILEKNPFEMRYLDPLIFAYRMQGKNELATKLEFQLGRIAETIFSSGDGLTENTAFYIIAPDHAYDMLRALGFGYTGGQSIKKGTCGFIKVKSNDFGIEGMYFKTASPTTSLK